MPVVELAKVLLGATGFKDNNNVNDTFHGQVLTSTGETRQAIIKDLDVVQLCNELVVHSLAREVGLPIPDCYLGQALPEILPLTKAPKASDGSRIAFVSVDVKAPNISFRWTGSDAAGQKALLDRLVGWDNLGDLYAFDAWIANIDRHGGNLLFGGKDEFWLIDHGHCFTGPNWQISDLVPDAECRSKLSEWLTQFLSSDQKRHHASAARRFSADIQGFDATEVSDNSRVSELLPLQNVNALKQFLEKRTDSVPVHASKALGVPTMV